MWLSDLINFFNIFKNFFLIVKNNQMLFSVWYFVEENCNSDTKEGNENGK